MYVDPARDVRRGEDTGAPQQGDRRQAPAHEGGAHAAAGAHQPAAPREVPRRSAEQVEKHTNNKTLIIDAGM